MSASFHTETESRTGRPDTAQARRPSGSDAPDAPAFTLVLATVDRDRDIAVLAGSLLAQTCRDFELVVVDQNEDERVAPHLEPLVAAGFRVNRIRCPRRGLSYARNRGLELARGAIVGFPDDDCWYEPDVLQRVLERLGGGGELDGVSVRWIELERYLGRTGTTTPLVLDEMRRFRGPVVTSISLFIRREQVERIGRFDDRLGVGCWYGASEETDLVLRLLESGARMRYLDDVVVHHAFPPRSLTEFSLGLCDVQRRRERGIGALYAKHRLSPWVIGRGLVAPLVRSVRAPHPLQALVRALYGVVGRIEGMARWRWRER